MPSQLLLAASLAALPFSATGAPLPLAPCTVEGVPGEVRCGTYEVFENRETRQGRTIPLKIVVLPATGAEKAPDPLVYFAGGPGDNATSAAPGFALIFADVRAKRDIVLIDVRGTGGSRALVCDSMSGVVGAQKFLDDFLPVEAVEACRKQWEGQADLTRFTTAELVDDVAEVVTALGYPQVNLMGGSYGTRAAQAFAARHPRLTRSMILEGVVEFDERMPISIARDAQNALDGWFAECAADPDCHAAFPRLREEFAAVLEQLRKAPVEVEVREPQSGEKVKLRLSANGFGQTVRYMLYIVNTSVTLPLYIHLAAQGNFQPIAETGLMFATALSGPGMADGLYLSVVCAEDVAFLDPAAIPPAIAGTFLGDFRITRQRDACAAWPYKKLGPETLAALRSDIPTLLISGERDPVTPAAAGEAVARGLSRSLHLVLPDGAHSPEGLLHADECLNELTSAFLDKASVAGLDTACVAKITRPPFLLKLETPTDIQLSAEELQRFEGSYTGLGEADTPVRFAEGKLTMVAPDGDSYVLLAITKTRFAIAGAPPGYVVEFQLDTKGQVTGAAVEQGPGRRTELTRKGG